MPGRTGRLLSIIWALELSIALAPSAQAADPCADDVRQFCPAVKPESALIAACLRENQARLSATCRAKVDADTLRARKVVEEFGRACRRDIEQLCAGVEPGGGRVLGCLAQHEPELSPPCEAQINLFTDARERVLVVRRACTADVARLCQGVPQQAGPLLECLKANEASLSSGCTATDLRQAVDAGVLVDNVEEMGRKDRVREALQILQGTDSVAFSRSQVLLQYDSFEALTAQGNASRLLFNPQFVFGSRAQYALQVKVPILTIYPYVPGAPTQHGLGAIVTGLGWNFLSQGQLRQYLGLGVQWQTAATKAVGGPWAVIPSYAIAVGLARWVSLTTQVVWTRSVDSGSYPEVNLLYVEPILVFALPGRSFLVLDTKLGQDFVTDTFLPVMKGVAGIYVDRQKSLSISAWYQAALSSAAEAQLFKYEVGLGLAYYFDW
jgi:hypothetical protein